MSELPFKLIFTFRFVPVVTTLDGVQRSWQRGCAYWARMRIYEHLLHWAKP
jgi:hypothetical protein